MSFRFEFRSYARRFKEPLQTALGQWRVREGFVLRMEDDDGTVGFGEVAPVPWFGTETLKIAETFLSSVKADGLPSKIPKGLPCCRFAISCCRSVMRQDFEPSSVTAPVAGLLPAGHASLEKMAELSAEGFRFFKWKMGIQSFDEERELLEALVRALPASGRLRIDANGSWGLVEAWRWLESLQGMECIEFIEDPLDPALWEATRGLADAFSCLLALDLPLTSAEAPRILGSSWPGYLVLKPSLFGRVGEVRELAQKFFRRMVFSTVFETAFGYEAVLRLALSEGDNQLALGMGGQDMFASDGLRLHLSSPRLQAGEIEFDALETAWREIE